MITKKEYDEHIHRAYPEFFKSETTDIKENLNVQYGKFSKPSVRYTCLNCGIVFYRFKRSGTKPKFHSNECRLEYHNKMRMESKYNKALDIVYELFELSQSVEEHDYKGQWIDVEKVKVWPKTFVIRLVGMLGYKWIDKQWWKE